LEDRGRLAALAYGGGRATAVGLEVTEPVPGAERVAADLGEGTIAPYTAALRARGRLRAEGEVVEMAVPPGSAMFVRGNTEVLGLLGAKCRACGTVNTPPSIHPACIACGGTELDQVPLGRTGTVQTFVVNQTMPAPFVAPLPLVVVDLDDGSRLMTQGAGDGTDVEVGARVELLLRRFTVERGVPVYGYKAMVVFPSIEVRDRHGQPADEAKVSLGGGGSW
jgi:hydroxymethylglutaryl-CoA synthase